MKRNKDYTSYINRKIFCEILDNSFNEGEKDIIEVKEEQNNILLELRKYMQSFTPKDTYSWYHRFEILKDSLAGNKNHSYIDGKTVLRHYNIENDLIMKNYLVVKINTSSHTRQKFYMVIFFRENTLNIEIPIHKEEYYNDDKKLEEIIVRFDKYQTTKEDIIKFIDALMDKQKELEEKQENKDLKKKKITALKSKTIVAMVKEIMKEKNMTYRFEEGSRKTILILKLAKSQSIEISITHKNIQDTLQKLSGFIDQLVELYRHGVVLKHKQIHKSDSYNWIH